MRGTVNGGGDNSDNNDNNNNTGGGDNNYREALRIAGRDVVGLPWDLSTPTTDGDLLRHHILLHRRVRSVLPDCPSCREPSVFDSWTRRHRGTIRVTVSFLFARVHSRSFKPIDRKFGDEDDGGRGGGCWRRGRGGRGGAGEGSKKANRKFGPGAGIGGMMANAGIRVGEEKGGRRQSLTRRRRVDRGRRRGRAGDVRASAARTAGSSCTSGGVGSSCPSIIRRL